MKLLLLLFMALPGLAQFRSIEITFAGIGCVTCIESLPGRIQRIRGVESATVDAEHGILKIQLAQTNRVRLEQVRDIIEQDGTKARKAAVRVQGALSQVDGKWVLQPEGVSATYELLGLPFTEPAGTYTVLGEITEPHPDSGRIVIHGHNFTHAQSLR